MKTARTTTGRKSSRIKISHIAVVFALTWAGILGLMKHSGLEFSLLIDMSFYKSLANPSVKIVRVPEGLRKEEIAELMSKNLGWSESEEKEFVNAHIALETKNLEGHYFPKTYLISKNNDPFDVSTTMFYEFSKKTQTIKKPKSKNVVSEDTALKIASIIQREAAGKTDMKLISGIIWNRLFSGMKLQIDATLQYAKGSEKEGWWEQVDPNDKKIKSPYNTYLYSDLPPYPIANPGLAAIEAAYNPQKTSCLYYLHDKNHLIHCAKTYEEHKKNIAKYLNKK